MREIDAATLQAWRATGTPHVLLDMRERGEFALGQIPAATPLPRGLLELRLPRVVPDRALPLVLYCDDGRRSALAAATCEQLGYADVRLLAGGLEAWRAAGGTVIEGWGVAGKAYGERVAASGAVPQMLAAELAARRARGEPLLVVDVRTTEEYHRGHVPDAYHVPGGELPRAIGALAPDRATPIVVSCAGRTRGILGAQLLREAGYERVWALLNGAMGWRLAGYALEEGSGRAPRVTAAGAEPPPWVAAATARLARTEGLRFLSAEAFAALRAAGVPHYAVDVRLPEAYQAGHVPGAISLPAGQLALHYENWLAVPTLPLVLLADDPLTPVWAGALCWRLGFPDVRVLEGGLAAWTACGGALEASDGVGPVFGLAAAEAAVPTVAPRDLAAALGAGGPVVLDVRGSGDFATGHVPGARWLARGKLELAIGRLVPDRATPVVTVCDTGMRATLAAATLRALGYAATRVLAGGLAAWLAAGLPLEEGLAGADVSVAEAQGDFGHTLWRGALERTPADMERYLTWEERLARPAES
jgi:rhodanese-related sulfurtransferase